MKVLMLNTLYPPFQVGGAERSTQLLAESLVTSGHDVLVACTMPESGIKSETVNGVRVRYIGLKNIYWQLDEETKVAWLKPLWHVLDSYNPFMKAEVENLIEMEEPDVVHTHNLGGFSVSVWRAAKEASVPVVHTLRDYALLCPRNMFRDGENCSSRCMQCTPFAAPRRWVSQQVEAVVGISQFILDRHRAFGYFENVCVQTVIHNPFVLPDDKSSQTPNRRTRNQAFDRPLQVGFLGRLSPMKGIDQLLRVVEVMPEEELHLQVGGTGSESYIKTLKTAHDSSNITFCGYVDPDTFLPGLDVLVVPSCWQEPFGRVVIEAYAHGIPVIAAQRGGLPEIVDDGETGWTYDPDSDAMLKRHLEKVCTSPEQLRKMRPAVRERAKTFGVDRHAQAYEHVYNRAIADVSSMQPTESEC